MLSFDEDGRAAIPMTCSLCRQDDQKAAQELRKKWGCDETLTIEEWKANESEDITSALEFSPCYACDGKDPDCPACNGTDSWKLFRCPHACLESWHIDVCHGVVEKRRGILPFPGGWMDQPALFVNAARVVGAELSRIEDAARERSIRDAATRSK